MTEPLRQLFTRRLRQALLLMITAVPATAALRTSNLISEQTAVIGLVVFTGIWVIVCETRADRVNRKV